MARRKRTIYDNDGTVVEQVIGISEDVAVMKMDETPVSSSDTIFGKEFNTSDVFDTFVGYMNPRLEITDIPDDGEGSKCLICGTDTNKNIRKICFDCMKVHRDNLYTKLKAAILSGEKTIKF